MCCVSYVLFVYGGVCHVRNRMRRGIEIRVCHCRTSVVVAAGVCYVLCVMCVWGGMSCEEQDEEGHPTLPQWWWQRECLRPRGAPH